jgi:hypothetical protein
VGRSALLTAAGPEQRKASGLDFSAILGNVPSAPEERRARGVRITAWRQRWITI